MGNVSFQPSLSFAHDQDKVSIVDAAIEPQRSNSAPDSLDSSSPSSNDVSLASLSSMPLTKEETSSALHVTSFDSLNQQQALARALDTWIGSVVEDRPSESSILSSSRDTDDDGSSSPPRLEKFAVDSVQILNTLNISPTTSPPRPPSTTLQVKQEDNVSLACPSPLPLSQPLSATQKSPPSLHEMALSSSTSHESLVPESVATAPCLYDKNSLDSTMVYPGLNMGSSLLHATSFSAHQLPVYDDVSSCFKLKIVGLADSSSTGSVDRAPLDSAISTVTGDEGEMPQSTSLASLQGFLTTVSEESEHSSSDSTGSSSGTDNSMESNNDISSFFEESGLVKDSMPTILPSKQSQASLSTSDENGNSFCPASADLKVPDRDLSSELLLTPSVVDPDGESVAEAGNVKIGNVEEEAAACETAPLMDTAGCEQKDSIELNNHDENANPLCENHNESSPRLEQEVDAETATKPLSRFKSNGDSFAIDLAALDWASLKITGRADREQTSSTNYQVVELDDVSSLGESVSASPAKYLIPAMMVRQHHMATGMDGLSESIPHPYGTLARTETIRTSESTRETESKIRRASATSPSDIASDSGSLASKGSKHYCGYIQRSPPHIKIAVFGSLLLLVAAAFLLGVAVKAGETSSLRGSADRAVSDAQSQVSMDTRISPPAASPISANTVSTSPRPEPGTMNTTETRAKQQASITPTRSEEQVVHSATRHESLPAKELPMTQPWELDTLSPSVTAAPSEAPSLPLVLSVQVPSAEKELSWFYISSSTEMPTFGPRGTDDRNVSRKKAMMYKRRTRFMKG
jgi:hypothetical protein